MKTNRPYLFIFWMFFTSLFASCYRPQNDQPGPNYPNNNNNGRDTSAAYTYDEEFNGSENSSWTFSNTADSNYGLVTNGAFEFVDYSTTYYPASMVFTGGSTLGNFTVQARIQCNNKMALLFGSSATDNGYAFYVDSNGYYSLYREGYGSVASTVVITSTQDTLYATKKGWNVLEVDQTNAVWTGSINGTQVFSMAAPTLAGAGFGFKIVPNTIGYADYLYVKTW